MAQSEFSEIRDFHKRISEEAENLIKKVILPFLAFLIEVLGISLESKAARWVGWIGKMVTEASGRHKLGIEKVNWWKGGDGDQAKEDRQRWW